MIEIVEASHEDPLCPYCDEKITRVLSKKIESNLGVRHLYFCDHCKKVLGISHRKGFWMG
jgi:uncharacterized protein with PIN domain